MTSNVKKIQTSKETRLRTICAPLTTRTRSHRRWIAIITRTSFLCFLLKRRKQRKNLTGWEAAILFLPATLELSGGMNGLYNLQSCCEQEYVRIETVFILELMVWPFGSIVLLRTTPRRGNTRRSARRLKHGRR